MKITKRILLVLPHLVLLTSLFWLASCATTRRTENLLSEAGFRRFAANSDAKMKHLMSLPPDQITIARINGKPFYVFPDPDHKQIFVGSEDEYQNYQQLLTYSQLNANSRVLAYEDDGPGDDTAKWVAWTSTTGWTHGSY